IKRTKDEGYIITGTGGNDGSDLFLLKIDSQGDTLWLKSYGNPNQDEGRYVQQTTDGGYIITGFTEFPAPRGSDIWLLKTDYKGDTLWTKTYGGKYFDGAFSVSETKNGGYFITGQYTIDGELGLEIHIWLLKTDSNGDTIWTKKINNGSWGDYAYSCKPTSDSGFIIVGETTSDNFDSDIYLLKLDRDNNVEWSNTIGRDLVENGDEKRFRGNDVTETVDGGYLITGFKRVEIEWDEYQDLCIVKTNNKGQLTDIIETKTKFIQNFELSQNYPNPFNPTTQIQYALPSTSNVIVTVYNSLGQTVKVFNEGTKEAGNHNIIFNGEGLSSGIYLYTV
ncbi:MAG: T9SS type A sorting domain-containing protein, partial [Ignavibacteria bacterium]|nr:T9SS type A sorting domain-containing protein [Ignavibacteria bacterium]